MNWGELTMRFEVNGETVVLQGDSSLMKSQISLKTMIKAIREGGQAVLVELGCMEVKEE